MPDQRVSSRTAPFYSIPERRIVSVEHPGIVRNVDRTIETLQGNFGICKILKPRKADAPANLVFRPEDAMARPLQSTSSPSNNVLLKITVPRRTGRKRKRGSDEPFSGSIPVAPSDVPARPRANDVLRKLRDNEGRYQVEVVGRVERSHVFRGIPDFVFSTTGSQFTNRFREQILPFDWDRVKQFDLDMAKGATTNVDIILPPSLSHGDLPFSYVYRQNPTVKQSVDTSGKVTTINTQQVAKILTHLVPYDIPQVPTHPRENCPPIETLDKPLQNAIAAIQKLFVHRPAWTRRGLRNSLQVLEHRHALRHAIPYVGYIFRSGPWRDAIIQFGHDPRLSPDYRFYQTAMFRTLPREPEVARDGGGGRRHNLLRPTTDWRLVVDPAHPNPTEATPPLHPASHLFTGQLPFPRDGRMWMLCDITDPILTEIICPRSRSTLSAAAAASTTQPPSPIPTNFPPPAPSRASFLRPTCDILSDGWFGSGTLAKLKTIMRNKIQTLLDDHVPDDAEFARILAFPDHVRVDDAAGTGNALAAFMLDPSDPGVSMRDLQLATEVRGTIKGTATWRNLQHGVVAAGRVDGEMESERRPASPPAGEGSRVGAQVQWRDVAANEEESEGEEEAIERAEMLQNEQAIAAAAAALREGEQEQLVQDEDDERVGIEE